MDKRIFESLPTAEVARLVREAGPKVCVFPINGTRRWFLLEYASDSSGGSPISYLNAATKRHIELYKLLFDHGIETLVTPIFGPDLLDRGEGYVRLAVEGMARLGTHPDFLDFYETYNVRTRFYGDYQDYLDPASTNYLSEIFERTTEETLSHDGYRLFFGIFAHDATETVASFAVDFYKKHGRVPNKRTIIESYYGEYVAPVDFFIGFDKFSAFDMPLISTGAEDLYFTVAPSPYLTVRQLRTILYDHIYVRPEEETDYTDLTEESRHAMHEFYQANIGKTQGVGTRNSHQRFWHPLPQVRLPESLEACP